MANDPGLRRALKQGQGQSVLGGGGRPLQLGQVIQARGPQRTLTRELANFSKVSVRSTLTVRLRAASASASAASVSIRATDNVLPLLITEVVDDELRIAARTVFNAKTPPQIDIFYLPGLKAVSGHKKASLHASGLRAKQLLIYCTDWASLTVSGVAAQVRATADGACRLDLEGLQAPIADAQILGSGAIAVGQLRELSVSINGKGKLTYLKAPNTVHSNSYAASRIGPRAP